MALIGEVDALASEPLFHNVWRLEVALAGERSEAVHDAVAGQPRSYRRVERPSYRTSRATGPQVFSDITVRRHAARRNLSDHLPHPLKKVVT